ncbi:MAG TPA: ATP-grasp domain-containing protein [Mesotoga sp.]|nr:ATP-grasp domain-containing protein [Mesotoga sp.]
MRVLVTGARMWYALNSIRLLARQGHEVFAADSGKVSGGLYSRYLKGKFIYPPVSEKSDEFIECLLKKIEELKIDLLFPTFEEGFVISRFMHKFEGRVRVIVPRHEHIQVLHDKWTMTQLASSLSIPVPDTTLLKDFDTSRMDFPLIVKPRDQRSAEGIVKVQTLSQLKKLSATLDGTKTLVQEWKTPHQICTTGLALDGKLKGNVIYHNIREYPESGGVGTCRVSIKCEKVESYVSTIVEALRYSGFISMDFLYDRNEDEYYLVDVNPRMSPGLLVAHTSGMDFVRGYMDMVDGDIKSFDVVVPGRGTYTTAMEIGWYFSTLFKGKFRNLKGFFKSRKGLKDDTWDIRDPLPFFVVLFAMAYTAVFGPFMGGQTKGFSLGATYDSEKFSVEKAESEKNREAG